MHIRTNVYVNREHLLQVASRLQFQNRITVTPFAMRIHVLFYLISLHYVHERLRYNDNKNDNLAGEKKNCYC